MVLSGVRVVDFTWVVGGPICTEYLAQMGAEVIKIESSGRPEYRKRDGWFPQLNGGKRSCTINLKHPRGIKLARQLVSNSDIVVENFATGVMERLGLSYDVLVQDNPQLIMLSMSGLGRKGPGSNLVAYGSLLQAYSGWTSLVKDTDLLVERMGVRPSWTDHVAGLMGVIALESALWTRERTKSGTCIDLSMLESVLMLMAAPLIETQTTGREPPIKGNSSTDFAPHGCYPCAGLDNWIAIAVYDDDQWRRLAAQMGNPDWALAVLDGPTRLEQRGMVEVRLSEWTRFWEAHDLADRLAEIGIPAAPSQSLDDLLHNSHLQERGFFVQLPEEGGTWRRALPWEDSVHGRGRVAKAPELGMDNDYVFRTVLGLSEAEVAQLTADGALV